MPNLYCQDLDVVENVNVNMSKQTIFLFLTVVSGHNTQGVMHFFGCDCQE